MAQGAEEGLEDDESDDISNWTSKNLAECTLARDKER